MTQKYFVGSDILPCSAVGSDSSWAHTEDVKNMLECLVILHKANIFWCGWVEVGGWAENQW